jgi:hypothetical protein
MSERVGRENRIVNDNGFGLAAEEADLELVPKLVVNRTRHVFAEPVEPATSLVAMPEAIVSHRQERPVLGQAFSIPGGASPGSALAFGSPARGLPGVRDTIPNFAGSREGQAQLQLYRLEIR